MIEVLQFVFSSFWHWLGSVMLIMSMGSAVSKIILAVRGIATCDDNDVPDDDLIPKTNQSSRGAYDSNDE